MKHALNNIFGESLTPLVVPAIILIVWEVVGQLRSTISPLLAALGMDKQFIPDFSFLLPISDIAPALYRQFADGTIYPYLWDTVWRSLTAFAVAAVLGILFGLWLGLSRRAERLFLPTVDAIRTVPPVALLPIIILFFGIGDGMKIIFILVGAIWPVVINTALAIKSVDPMYLKVAFNAGHSRESTLWRVILPASLPGIFAGLKISLSLSIILAIVGEMMVGNTGLGFFINYTKRNFDYDEMYAGIIVVALLGWLVNRIIHQVDRNMLAWYYRSREIQMDYHHPWSK